MVCRLRAAEEREGALKTDVEQLEARLCELAGANAVLSLESESTKSAKAELVQSVAREARISEAVGHLQMQVDALEKRSQMQHVHCSELQQVHCSELQHERQTREDAARDHGPAPFPRPCPFSATVRGGQKTNGKEGLVNLFVSPTWAAMASAGFWKNWCKSTRRTKPTASEGLRCVVRNCQDPTHAGESAG